MQEQYSNVCKNIIKNYSKYILSDEEIIIKKIILNLTPLSDKDIIVVKKVIKRIWDSFLTKVEDFDIYKPFKFLAIIKDVINPLLEKELPQITENSIYPVRLITNEMVLMTHCEDNGVIIDYDFLGLTNTPILPNDFDQKNSIMVQGKATPIGMFNASLNISFYSEVEKLVKEYCEKFHLEFINISRPLLNYINGQKVLNKIDLYCLANDIIAYYLEEVNKLSVRARECLYKKYVRLIHSKFMDYFNNKITLDEYITEIFQVLDNDPLVISLDKKM